MKQRSLSIIEGVLLALVASGLASFLYNLLTTIAPMGWVLRVIIAGLGFGYMLYLLRRSRLRVGRIVVFTIWLVLAGIIWLLPIPFPIYALLHLGILWLVRSLYFYASILSALADLALTGFSALGATLAMLQTGSVFVAVWCFFLCQALFVLIPKRMRRRTDSVPHTTTPEPELRFESAHQLAEAALKNLYDSQTNTGDYRHV